MWLQKSLIIQRYHNPQDLNADCDIGLIAYKYIFRRNKFRI